MQFNIKSISETDIVCKQKYQEEAFEVNPLAFSEFHRINEIFHEIWSRHVDDCT